MIYLFFCSVVSSNLTPLLPDNLCVFLWDFHVNRGISKNKHVSNYFGLHKELRFFGISSFIQNGFFILSKRWLKSKLCWFSLVISI